MTEEPTSPSANERAELASEVLEAIAALRAGAPDSVPLVRIRGAYRDLNAKGNGSQTYRRVIYPGQRTSVWPDCGRMPRLGGYLASERRCAEHCEVSLGSLILDYEASVSRYRPSKATLRIALVGRTETGAKLHWLDYRVLRAKPIIELTLPDGSTFEIAKPERD